MYRVDLPAAIDEVVWISSFGFDERVFVAVEVLDRFAGIVSVDSRCTSALLWSEGGERGSASEGEKRFVR